MGTIRDTHLLANSEWTAGVTEELYDVRPDVVYPPVDTEGFFNVPWEERENGFITLGRVHPTKNVLRTIEIIRRLRERDNDVHLHIVGPTAHGEYGDRVRSAARKHDFVFMEGEVSRNRLIELASWHRYGIHGMDHEHFGMAVAELAAGGTIPFVPNGGGQREIVRERTELLYNGVEEAVEKIVRTIGNADRQRELRRVVGDVEQRFGTEKFRQQIREHVAEVCQ